MRNKEDYPIEWYDTIRPAILKRDNYKCKKCGIKHRQWVAKDKNKNIIKIDKDETKDYIDSGYKVYQIFLHVCHKDNNKSNVSEYNLITLCVTDHARLDGAFKALMRKGNKIKKQITIFDEIRRVEKYNNQMKSVTGA